MGRGTILAKTKGAGSRIESGIMLRVITSPHHPEILRPPEADSRMTAS